MGYMCHHAIVVSSFDSAILDAAHKQAKEMFEDELVSGIVPGLRNGYSSFFIAPDGSKEGWDESDRCDAAREAFVNYLRSQAYGDGSSPIDYVEVAFADDNLNTEVLNSSNDDYKKVIERDEDADDETKS